MSFCWRHLLIPLLVGAFHFHTFSSTSESVAPKFQFPDKVFPAHQRIVEWFKLRERTERPSPTEIKTYNSSTPTEAFTSTATSTSSESSTFTTESSTSTEKSTTTGRSTHGRPDEDGERCLHPDAGGRQGPEQPDQQQDAYL